MSLCAEVGRGKSTFCFGSDTTVVLGPILAICKQTAVADHAQLLKVD
jgi:hypothetical protein